MEQMFFPVTQKKASQTGVERSSAANKNAIFPTQLRDLRREKAYHRMNYLKYSAYRSLHLDYGKQGTHYPTQDHCMI